MEKEGAIKNEEEDKSAEKVEAAEPARKMNLMTLVKKLQGLTIQKYLEKPCLVRKRKFDIRYFMLIACTKPYLVMTNTGYARLSLEDYCIDPSVEPTCLNLETREERARHLTNASV